MPISQSGKKAHSSLREKMDDLTSILSSKIIFHCLWLYILIILQYSQQLNLTHCNDGWGAFIPQNVCAWLNIGIYFIPLREWCTLFLKRREKILLFLKSSLLFFSDLIFDNDEYLYLKYVIVNSRIWQSNITLLCSTKLNYL